MIKSENAANICCCNSIYLSLKRKLPKRNFRKLCLTLILFSIFLYILHTNFTRTQFHTHKVTNEKSKLEDLSKVRLVTKKDDNKNTDDDYYEELLNEFKVKEILYTTSSESLSKTNNRTNHCDDTNIELGPLKINKNISREYEDMDENVIKQIQEGGCHIPTGCIREKVAIIIPYKDRESHLKKLLYHLHPLLVLQHIEYCIYVTEQLDDGQFNKAMIMNAGFEEALKQDGYDCVIFHDVDMLPEDSRNLYTCKDSPVHLSPAIDKFEYKPDYGTKFGGVIGITPNHYRRCNGHSNRFWGWGGEDNDMEYRIAFAGLNISSVPLEIGRYQMITHKASVKFSHGQKEHIKLEKNAKSRATTDGLSDLSYRLHSCKKEKFYTKFMIDIQRVEIEKILAFINEKPVETFDNKPAPCYWNKFENKSLAAKIEFKEPYQIESLEEAKQRCLKIGFPCMGFTKMRYYGKDVYELRMGVNPHNFVVSSQYPVLKKNNITGKMEKTFERRFNYPPRTAWLYTCPGDMSALHAYKDKLLYKKNFTNTYRFEIHLKTLKKFKAEIYYTDQIALENKEDVSTKERQRFLYSEGKLIDFNSDTKHFAFSSRPCIFPEFPGSFMVTSKLVDEHGQPFYTWNWWYESTSGSIQLDSEIREDFYKSRKEEKRKELIEQRSYLKKAEKAEKIDKSV